MSAANPITRTPAFTVGTVEARPGWRLADDSGNDWSWAYVIHRDVPGWPGYVVGSDGSVWCRGRNRTWKRKLPSPQGKGGHPFVSLWRGRDYWRVAIHTLVLTAMVGARPDDKECCHFPVRDPWCNHLWNLRWDTRKANHADARKHGTWVHGSKVGNSRFTEDEVVEMRRMFDEGILFEQIGERFGLSRAGVGQIVRGKHWKCVPQCQIDAATRSAKVQVRGSRSTQSVLTEADIPVIRRLVASGVKQKELAARYNVTKGTISHVVSRRNWRHIPDEG